MTQAAQEMNLDRAVQMAAMDVQRFAAELKMHKLSMAVNDSLRYEMEEKMAYYKFVYTQLQGLNGIRKTMMAWEMD